MPRKKTSLLVAELRVLADFQMNGHCRDVVLQAAERLEDTDAIARFFHKISNGGNDGKKKPWLHRLSLLHRHKDY